MAECVRRNLKAVLYGFAKTGSCNAEKMITSAAEKNLITPEQRIEIESHIEIDDIFKMQRLVDRILRRPQTADILKENKPFAEALELRLRILQEDWDKHGNNPRYKPKAETRDQISRLQKMSGGESVWTAVVGGLSGRQERGSAQLG
jgi:hypothetical protein